MAKKKPTSASQPAPASDPVPALRAQAEEQLTKTPADVAAMSADDVQALVHELQVHQVELQMQNEELRRTQFELALVRDRYRDLYEFAPVAYLTVGLDLKVREANLTATVMFGWDRGKMLGVKVAALAAPHDRSALHLQLERTLLTATKQTCELDLCRLDNRSCFFGRVESAPIASENPGTGGLWMTISDLSERKRAEEELQRAKEAAEAANKAKSQFLANMSHELRTPMSAIMGMTDLALSEEMSPAVREYLVTARQSADVLLDLLNEVLDFSRIEAGRYDLESAPFSLRAVLEQTIKSMGVRAYEKKLELICDLSDDLPDEVVGDALRLRQVLVNLIGNAIKFTERGEVVVRAAVEARGERGEGRGEKGEDRASSASSSLPSPFSPLPSSFVAIRFSVEDTGIGISAEDRAKIFAPFTQADLSTTRRFGGSGLGLTISRSLVELMGGTIGVESREGSGSTFEFTIPVGRAPSFDPDARRLQAVREGLRGVPVMIVAENSTARGFLERTLAGWSMRPECAPDVRAALTKMYQAAEAQAPFSVVIADAVLPDVDGFALAGWIRQDPKLAGGIILMGSPFQRPVVPSRCREVGAVYLEKPICRTELSAALAKALGAQPAPGKASVTSASVLPAQPPTRPLRVLLAEDAPANRVLSMHVLQRRGHAVAEAADGQRAVELAREQDFDVVLMDVQMPGLDGFQATAAIRAFADPKKARLPIVALTAHALKGDLERCLEAGMNAYLSKPFQPAELIEIVERMADHNPVAETGRVPPRDERPRQPAAVAEPPPVPVFNLAEGVARSLGKYDLFQQMVDFFYQESDPMVQNMRAAIAEGNADDLVYAAHRLRGTILYLGSGPAMASAERLERIGRLEDLTLAGDALEELERWIDLLKSALAPHRLGNSSTG